MTNTAVAWPPDPSPASTAPADMYVNCRGKSIARKQCQNVHSAVASRSNWSYQQGSLVTSGPAIGCHWFEMGPTTGSRRGKILVRDLVAQERYNLNQTGWFPTLGTLGVQSLCRTWEMFFRTNSDGREPKPLTKTFIPTGIRGLRSSVRKRSHKMCSCIYIRG